MRAVKLRWSHVALNCRDQRVTEQFYHRWFGFRRARVVPLSESTEIIFLRKNQVYLELFQAEPAASRLQGSADGPAFPGVARHLAFQADDLGAFLAKVGQDIPVSMGPLEFDAFIPGWHSVWLTDPDGVIIEVSQGYKDQDPSELAAAHGHAHT